MAWVSPTSFSDPDSGWNNEPNAYDEDDDSSAYSDPISGSSGGSPSTVLDLDVASLSCNKIRFWASYYALGIRKVNIFLYYNGGFHNIFSGAYANKEWVEVELSGTYDVTSIRFQFFNYHLTIDYRAYLWEVDFWEVEAVGQVVQMT